LRSYLTRREVLHRAAVGAAALTAGGVVAACGGSGGASGQATDAAPASQKLKRGGTLQVGATGGGSADTIDAQAPVVDPDIMRVWQLFEPLAIRSANFSALEMVLAESIEPVGTRPDLWTVRLKPGIEFHNGKTVDADDVIYSLRRILNPKSPKSGATSLAAVDVAQLAKLDARTVRIPLKSPDSVFPDDIGQYFNTIVPVGYDPKQPIGTGAFRYHSFTPGQQSVFVRNGNYWRAGEPYVDEVVIQDFPDDNTRLNALTSGQVQAIDNLPAPLLSSLEGNSAFRVLRSSSGSWEPFTMRTDQPPFNDVRVRQAFRLIVDRPKMLELVLNGQGRIANDLYSPYDPDYDSALPQRKQDLDQAKYLLKQAGQSGVKVELVTAPIYQGIVQAAEVFAEQAKGAGVSVNLRQLDSTAFFGPNYLSWTFAQDYWSTLNYLTQVEQSTLPGAAYNETHFDDPQFIKLIAEARATLDAGKRRDLVHAAQQIEWDTGGYIIPYFPDYLDGYTARLSGFAPAAMFPLGNYGFRSVGYVS
jgi:peptide/nickel transport system substrate-binding protein